MSSSVGTDPVRPGTLLISEVLPSPRQAFTREWVELFNPGREAVDTAGWSIDDAVDGGALPLGARRVEPGGYLLVELERAILNNSGDTVRLLGPNREVVDSYSFGPTPVDRSHSRDPIGGAWRIGDPTPGAPNRSATGATNSGEAVVRNPTDDRPVAAAPDETSEGAPAADSVRGHSSHPAMLAYGSPGPRIVPTYTGGRGEPYRLPTALPDGTPVTPPSTPTSPDAQAPAPRLDIGAVVGGVILIVIACVMLIGAREPASEKDRDSVI